MFSCDMIIITKTVKSVKKGDIFMNSQLFEQLKKYYEMYPEKLDSLTKEDFETIISNKKGENNYDNYFEFIYYSSIGGTVRV